MGQPIQFSEREKEVMGLLLQGKGNKQIALDLGISRRTVEFHLSKIYAKLDVGSRAEAILKLTETHLRESTGVQPVTSTVDKAGDSTEDGSKSILRRMPVKRLYLILGGLAAVLIATAVLLRLTAQPSASPSGTPLELTPVTNLLGVLPTAVHNPTSISTETIPAPVETDPPAAVAIASHTVNGYTAAIESYFVDASTVLFQVRIRGGETEFGDEYFYGRIESPDLYDEDGNPINTSGGFGPAVDPALVEFRFVPATLLKGDRFKGQFAFDITNAPDYDEVLARFRFDLDLPVYPEMRFYPKQEVTANGLKMLLDSVTVTPLFSHAYVCFPPPSYAPWHIGSETALRLDKQEATLHTFSLPFASDLGGDRRAGSEPYWVPPIKDGRCMKVGFPIGSANPASLTLTIPALENLDPNLLLTDQLSLDYPGLSPREAYYTYLAEHDRLYAGPWVFHVELVP